MTALWQDSFPVIKTALKEYGIAFGQIDGVFVSHVHPDHAGTVELLRQHGITPNFFVCQISKINWLNDFFKQKKNDPGGHYVSLSADALTPIDFSQAREILTSCGIDGEFLPTPGHSDDSVSLIVGDKAFVGDLPPKDTADSDTTVAASWRELTLRGVRNVHFAHGNTPDEIAAIEKWKAEHRG